MKSEQKFVQETSSPPVEPYNIAFEMVADIRRPKGFKRWGKVKQNRISILNNHCGPERYNVFLGVQHHSGVRVRECARIPKMKR